MGAAESSHADHAHHKAIKDKLAQSRANGGVVVLKDEELKHVWEHYDTNHNDQLDYHELDQLIEDLISHTVSDAKERKALLSHIKKHDKGNLVDVVFAKLKNKDGIVTYEAFCSAYHHVGKDFHEMFTDYNDKAEPSKGCCIIA